MTLEEMRRKAYLTQERVARELNVTSATIGNWERGRKRPRITSIPVLARLYNVSPQEIEAAIDQALREANNTNAEEE